MQTQSFKTSIANFYKAVREASESVCEVSTFTWGGLNDFELATQEKGGYIFAMWSGGQLNRESGATMFVTMFFLSPDFHGNAPMNDNYGNASPPSRDVIMIESMAMCDKFFDAITDWIKANPSCGIGISPVANTTPELLAFTAMTSGYVATFELTIGKMGCEDFRPFTDQTDCQTC